mgnify:CR=1 FL=1
MVKTTKQQQHVSAATFVVVTLLETHKVESEALNQDCSPARESPTMRGRDVLRRDWPSQHLPRWRPILRKPSESEADLPVTGLSRGRARGGFRILFRDDNTAKIRSVTVGIFDNAHDLEQAAAQLASAGFDGTAVYDEAIVRSTKSRATLCPVGPVPVSPVLAPGVVPGEVAAA